MCCGNIIFNKWKNFYKKFKNIHCPSDLCVDIFKDESEINMHVFSCGISDYFYKREIEKPTEYKNKFIISCIGNFESSDKQDIICRAVSKSKHKDDIILLFDGDETGKKK